MLLFRTSKRVGINSLKSLNLLKLPQKRNYINYIQDGLYNFQSLTGLPWWLSIATSTILVKTTLLPVVRLQIIAINNFAKILPELTQLITLLNNSILKNKSKTLK